MKDKMEVSSNPHIRDKMTTSQIMGCVVIALLPATIFGIWNFGLYSLLLILVTVGAAVLTEFLFCKICHKTVTLKDGSAVVTGLLLALNLPPHLPLWIGIFGGVFVGLGVALNFSGGGTGSSSKQSSL